MDADLPVQSKLRKKKAARELVVQRKKHLLTGSGATSETLNHVLEHSNAALHVMGARTDNPIEAIVITEALYDHLMEVSHATYFMMGNQGPLLERNPGVPPWDYAE